jgi:ATP-dependent Clp protease ATP-binding subunit ClpA
MGLFRAIDDMRTIKTLLNAAETHAKSLGDDRPGGEHLLLAALDLPDGTARAAFQAVGANPDELQSAIKSVHAEALQNIGVDTEAAGSIRPAPNTKSVGPYNSSPSLQALFKRSSALARTNKRTRLQGAHVVIAATEAKHGTVAQTLRAMGVDLDTLRQTAENQLSK